MTKRQHSSFGLSADFITEYKEQTVNEVQILGTTGLKIMVSFLYLLVSSFLSSFSRFEGNRIRYMSK